MAERRAGEGVDFNLLNAAVGDAGAFPSHRIDMTVSMTRGFRAVFVFAIGNLLFERNGRGIGSQSRRSIGGNATPVSHRRAPLS
jgi:hypothetical protein